MGVAPAAEGHKRASRGPGALASECNKEGQAFTYPWMDGTGFACRWPVRARMRIAIAILALLAIAVVPPTVSASHNCNGTVTVTSYSPAAASAGSTLSIRVVFQGDGPGYIPGECDIGWITTCRLLIDGQEVAETCFHTNGDDRCHESAVVYECTVALTASVPVSTGTHSVAAILGMTWGCCGWIGGQEATAMAAWQVHHVNV